MIKHNGLEKKLAEMREKTGKAAAARIYPLYQKLQAKRFETENASEGVKWKPIQKEYAEHKLKAFKSFPGGGRKTLIATSTLGGAVIGRGSPFLGQDKHVAIFKKYGMQISVKQGGVNAAGKPFTYASFVAEKRPYMEFSKNSIEIMKTELRKFILGG